LDPSLVQLITELVMAELNRDAGLASAPGVAAGPPATAVQAAVAAAPSSRQRKALLVPAPAGDSHGDPLWQALGALNNVSWTAVRVPGVSESKVGLPGARWIDPPLVWDELVHQQHAVVLPVLRLETLSRLAVLLGDTPASGAAIAAVMQGVPVFASAWEADRLKRSSGRLPGPFLSMFHQHLRTVEGMGVQVLEAAALAQRLGAAGPSGTAVAAASRGRDVITVADLEAAARAGQKTLQVTPGAIVTPLARDTAAHMGIEVVFS
jgi:hypothetical protein